MEAIGKTNYSRDVMNVSGDENFGQVCNCVMSMPNLSNLDLSTSGLTSKSLMSLSRIADSPSKEEYKLFMKVCFLYHHSVTQPREQLNNFYLFLLHHQMVNVNA